MLLIDGANGSGKTSLLRATTGLLPFESGQIQWNGQAVENDYQSFRAELVWLSHRVGFKSDLTVLENLKFESGLRSTRTDTVDEVLDRLGISRVRELPFRFLSAGQQRRVALARMLLSTAQLWIMDEPFTNLDKAGQSLVLELIAEHLRGGGLAVVASHQDIELDGALPIRRVTLQ